MTCIVFYTETAKRLTFGVTTSPYLASQVLHQVAEDQAKERPLAASIIRQSFYVDDCPIGADTLEEAIAKQEDVNSSLR